MPDRLTLDAAGFPCVHGRPLELAPKERAVLALLLTHQPRVVSKTEFAERAWAGQTMSDESLARSISRVRRAIAPLGGVIDAVYGTGYRLTLAAAAGDDAAPSPLRLAGVAHAASQATVDAYLHARQLALSRTPAGVGRAIDLLRALLAREPGYTPAAVALGEALAAAVGWGQVPTDDAVREGLAVLDTAQAVEPHTAGLAAARGSLLDMAWQFEAAGHAHAQALQAARHDPDTLLLSARHHLMTGEAEVAVQLLREALALSPHAPLLRMTLSRALVQAGRGAEAVAEAQAAQADHPGQLLLVAFALAMQAMVAPSPALEAPAWRLSEGTDTPPFVWTVLSFVLARIGQRAPALDVIDAALLCSRTTTGEASLYAAPLAALGEVDRAADLLERALSERCGMLAMVLQDPAHRGWLTDHPRGQALRRAVFGDGA